MTTKPTLLNWLICDGVHIDPATGKQTILGVFSAIRGQQFPLKHPFMIWFMSLTNCEPGEHKVKISMGLDPNNATPVIDRTFQAQSPAQSINLINQINNLTIQEPGDYSIVVEIDGEILLATNLQVMK